MTNPNRQPRTERSLIEQWSDEADVARGWRSGDDPEPVLSVLALSIALELTGELGQLPAADRASVRKLGQQALLQVGGAHRDEDELEALRLCARIARDGLRALSGRRPDDPPCDQDLRTIIPPADLVRLLRGALDGFAAGSLAMRVRRSARARAELRLLWAVRRSGRGEGRELLALAAAGTAPVLDPEDGRALGVHPVLGVEAVLFESGGETRLALYAEDPAPLRLVAPQVTTEDVREGYWIGSVAAGHDQIEATLHAGERSEPWVLRWQS